MGNDSEDGSIKYRFSSEGSDEVIAAAKKMVDELNATAAAMRKLAEEIGRASCRERVYVLV